MRARVLGLALALLVVCLCSAAMAAEEGVPLAFRFADGNAITYDVMFSGAGKLLDANSQASVVTIQGTATLTQTVAKVQEDGSAVLDTLLPNADITLSIKDQKVRFSYANGQIHWYANGQEKAPPQVPVKLPLLQSPIRVTTKTDGSITDVGFADAQFMDMLRQAVPNMPASLPSANSAPILPANPVRVGESWTQSQDLPVGEGLKATARTRRTLESLQESGGMQMAKISGYAEATFRSGNQSIAGPGGQQLSFAIPEMKQTVTSTEFFNVGSGRLVRGDYDMVFTTKLSLGLGGTNQSGAVKVRMRGTVVCR